jgi:hypothetical protein
MRTVAALCPRALSLPLRSISGQPRALSLPFRSTSGQPRALSLPLRSTSGQPRALSLPLRSTSGQPRALSLPLRGIRVQSVSGNAADQRRSINGQSQAVSNEQVARAVTDWQDSAAAGKAPPLRFPVGTPVECFAGDDGWLRGTVCAHQYREPSWAAELPTVPYQVLLDSMPGEAGEPSAIWAPADVEEIVRASFRFELEDVADCRVAQDEWVRCTVVGRYYREKDWEEGTCAPYQVRVDGALPGCRDDSVLSLAASGDALIWIPRDAESYIRAASEERDERLRALVGLAQGGVLSEEALQEKRRGVIHSSACSDTKI